MRFLDVEVIFAIHVYMGIPGGPDMGEITVLHGIAFLLQLLHNGRHVDRIPDNDRIGHQIETERLMSQRLAATLVELAFVRHHHKGAQVVQRLTFVELPEEAAPILRIGIPP